ncbi:MAG: hypothetical protein GYA42_00145 [Syntrophomonadaceae bacterium]|nr:hypothetical protein [Syntrophomonadaceae bacterium]
MAIDRNKTESLIKQINDLFDTIPVNDPSIKQWVKDKVMGAALKDIEEFINNSRSPRMLILGRSGHGKSSLINALCNQKVAEAEDPVRPNSSEAIPYHITFPEKFSSWDIIDTRGFFESTSPSGAADKNAEDALLDAVAKYKPDVLMHIIAAKEVRNLENDLKLFSSLKPEFQKLNSGKMIPTIVCVNQVDVFGSKKWPPEEHPKKAGEILELLDYFCKDIIKVPCEKLDNNDPLKGFKLDYSDNNPYISVIPICCFWDADDDYRWNINTLYDYIGNTLPDEALFDFFQAAGRREGLKKLSSGMINRFTAAAGLIGASPIPFADIALLIPLQLMMIAIIGGLSCRSLSMQTANEYLAAAGVDLAGGYLAKQLARQLLKFVPGPGDAISAGIAGSTTYGIGKAAEAYFFKE